MLPHKSACAPVRAMASCRRLGLPRRRLGLSWRRLGFQALALAARGRAAGGQGASRRSSLTNPRYK
eukprot:3037862-Pyramimonas_sp.AAC.1